MKKAWRWALIVLSVAAVTVAGILIWFMAIAARYDGQVIDSRERDAALRQHAEKVVNDAGWSLLAFKMACASVGGQAVERQWTTVGTGVYVCLSRARYADAGKPCGNCLGECNEYGVSDAFSGDVSVAGQPGSCAANAKWGEFSTRK